MSNIITAYDEVYRTDGKHISRKDRGRIYHGLIKAYHRFGSYWVRICVEYDSERRCIRIQHGSGKCYADRDTLIDSDWFRAHFVLWTRWANEGYSPDSLLIAASKEIVQLCSSWGLSKPTGENARYGFDAVMLGGPVEVLSSLARPLPGDRRYLLDVSGTYEILTDRAFVDMTMHFDGPELTYDVKYSPKRFIFDDYGPQRVEWHSLAWALPKEVLHFFSLEPGLDFVALCWQGRAIHILHRRGYTDFAKDPQYWHERDALPAGLCAAGWANLVNPSYLAFRAWHAEQVRLADQKL
ncbi:hypothetical protein [Deinococcus sp.]|uniref:hypothetical protein n=1 Tax=Deinococcus sp. TaxID=47478 RepID=UPI0025CBF40B|nr:hypothetical protein [Deinococcus sp.]